MRTDVTDFEHPALAERALYGQVPLLRVRNNEMARHRQTKDELRRQDAWTPAGAGVIRKHRRISAGETLERSQAWDEVWIEHTSLRQRVDACFEEVREASGSTASEGHGKVRSLEA